MKSTLALTLFLVACAESAQDGAINSRTSGKLVIESDCDTDAGYSLDTFEADKHGGLQVIGIYEPRNDDPPWWSDPSCSPDPMACWPPEHKPHPGFVHVAKGGPTALFLTSYEPTNWTITADPGAQLAQVILSGYYDNTAVVPDGVKVTTLKDELGYAGFEWLTDEDLALQCTDVESAVYCEHAADYWKQQREQEAAQMRHLVAEAEQISGMKLHAFAGCYAMSTVSFSKK